jgi:integral membrane sensor domain MASE1
MLNSVTIICYIVSFVLLYYQYYRTSASNFDFNLHFFLMVGALTLMIATIIVTSGWYPLAFFVLGLLWLALSAFLFRRMLRAD